MTGNVGRVSLNKGKYNLLNQRVGLIVPKQKQYHEFIFQILNSAFFTKKMEVNGQGAAQKNIGKNDILLFKLPFTNDNVYLSRLITLFKTIDQEKQKQIKILEEITNLKKECLNKMFI